MKLKIRTYEHIVEALVWLPIMFLSALLIKNSLAYFTFDSEAGILPEKENLSHSTTYLTFFYIHVAFGFFCLVTPIINFIGRHFKLSLLWHAFIGHIYVWALLIFVSPTGIYLALFAKGGFWSQLGFTFHGLLVFGFTLKGYLANKTNIQQHIFYMIRSYAMVSAILSFRIFHLLFLTLKLPYEQNYAVSQWLSFILNWAIAELIILYIMAKRESNHTLKFILT